MSRAVQRYVRAVLESIACWQLPDYDGHSNVLNASAVARSSSKNHRQHRQIRERLWRSCLAVLLWGGVSGGAAADEPRDRAVELLREAVQYMKSLPEEPSEVTSGSLIRIAEAYVKAGDSTTAGQLLVDAWNASLKGDGAGRFVQLRIVELQADIGQADFAINAVQQQPSSFERAVYLGQIAEVQAKRGDATAVIHTVSLIPVEDFVQDDFSINMRDMALTSIADAFSEHRHYADAINILEMIGEEKLKATGQIMVAHDQAEAGDLTEAFQTAHAIAGESHRDVAMRLILCAAADRMEVATARETFIAIKNQPQKDFGATCLVASLCRRKQLEEAASIVKDIQEASLKARGLLEIAIAHAANGDIEETRALLDQSMVVAPMEVDLKNDSMKRIVEALVKSGYQDQGQEFAEELIEPDARSVSFQAIAIAQWKKGSKDIAQRAILESRKAANEIPDPYFRSVRLREFAVVLADLNAKEESLVTMKSALAAGRIVEPAGGTDVLNLTEIATSQMAKGNIDGADATFEIAYTTARAYSDRPYSAALLAGVIEAQAHFGNSTRAIEIAQEEKSPDLRVGMLVAAANGLLAR